MAPDLLVIDFCFKRIIARSSKVVALSNRMQKLFLKLINTRKIESEEREKAGKQPSVSFMFFLCRSGPGKAGFFLLYGYTS